MVLDLNSGKLSRQFGPIHQRATELFEKIDGGNICNKAEAVQGLEGLAVEIETLMEERMGLYRKQLEKIEDFPLAKAIKDGEVPLGEVTAHMAKNVFEGVSEFSQKAAAFDVMSLSLVARIEKTMADGVYDPTMDRLAVYAKKTSVKEDESGKYTIFIKDKLGKVSRVVADIGRNCYCLEDSTEEEIHSANCTDTYQALKSHDGNVLLVEAETEKVSHKGLAGGVVRELARRRSHDSCGPEDESADIRERIKETLQKSLGADLYNPSSVPDAMNYIRSRLPEDMPDELKTKIMADMERSIKSAAEATGHLGLIGVRMTPMSKVIGGERFSELGDLLSKLVAGI